MSLPNENKKLRACLLCSIIQNMSQFKRDGCPNCEEVLRLRGSTDRVLECTSPAFDGMVALMNPPESWCARWQRIERFQQGLYAIRISGRLPEDIVDQLDNNNIKYVPRDGSVKD